MSDQSANQWLLKIAAEVEQDPKRWTKGKFARDALGEQVPSTDGFAVCWCAAGFHLRDRLMLGAITALAIQALEKACGTEAETYNDSLATAAEFIAWFRMAAELCE